MIVSLVFLFYMIGFISVAYTLKSIGVKHNLEHYKGDSKLKNIMMNIISLSKDGHLVLISGICGYIFAFFATFITFTWQYSIPAILGIYLLAYVISLLTKLVVRLLMKD